MDARQIPARPSLEQYRKQAKDLLKAFKSGDSDAIQRIKRHHPHPSQPPDSGSLSSKFTLADAQVVLAREHAFESWPKFAKHIEALTSANSPVSQFELAADAIVAGSAAMLKRLLRENPQLIRERSTRVHRARLLHYVAANGFEDYRQKSPKNVVEIAKLLLSAGAEVDAVADAYSHETTLGLVASSVHPKLAGVQIALLEALLEAGAAIDGVPGASNPLISALRNGHGEAAKFLVERGARLDLEGAAGVGRLDVVQSFFGHDGNLKATATKAQMESGFLWACEYGRNNVVEFLLQKGMDVNAQADTGLTGLHWAVVGGQLATIKLLLKRKAPLEAKNVYGGTALGQALWSALNGDSGIDYVEIIDTLIEGGAKIEPGSLAWLAGQRGASATKVRLEALLHLHGTTS
jgi:ankyrin repeat protein